MPDLEFIYVGDPMCSWCWGFAPVLERLDERYDVPVRIVVGGLRPGDAAEPLDDGTRRTIAHHWEQVGAASGQPFDHSFLERDGWVYDTEPSCRAVVAMRDLSPADALRWFARIQRAFYAEATDVTDLAVFPELLDGFDVDRQKYAEVLHAEETRTRTWEDFARARRWGIMGFPTLLVRDGDDLAIVTRGFLPWEQLEPPLTRWIEQRFGPAAEGLVCAVDD
ncbi:MAG: DsbA family protein [Actinomycetota bacterium]|nr:DsbA family protein [Actinomycetota bacterium]